MNIAIFLKENLKNIPPSIGEFINKLPYSARPGIGDTYKKRKKEIKFLENASEADKKSFIFDRVFSITIFAFNNIKFYKEHYKKLGFNPNSLKSFDDLKNIPIITKEILNEYDIDDRSYLTKNRYVVNTGGSSGTPFSFYIEPSSMGHEWAHIHNIWNQLEYKPSDLKLVFGGRSDVKDYVEYDVVRNHFSLDIYADYKKTSLKLKKILSKHCIKYLHGYPSSIYNFAIFCEENDQDLKRMLSKNLKGIFLGSEFPHKHYRLKIEEVFKVKTISWYGHTERAVLAFEKNKHFTYYPFLTYGYTEVIPTLNNNEFSLLSTSYYNYASPLIRYNTEDTVSDLDVEYGILKFFSIKKGRSGEEVIDRNGVKLNLTGLIFGRHHKLFDHTQFIQVLQKKKGEIEIHFVSKSLQGIEAKHLFDSENLDLDICFKRRESPYRTKAGKINLLIK